MPKTTNLRRLRIKYNIPLRALAEKLDVSTQFLSCVELGIVQVSKRYEERLQRAIEMLVAESIEVLFRMEREFDDYNGKLLQESEVPDEC